MDTKAYAMLVNGKLVSAPTTFDVINPSTGQPFAKAPDCSKETLDEAVAAAKAAFPAWSKSSHEERAGTLRKCMEKLKGAEDQLAELLVKEQGKALAAAKFEINWIQVFLESFTAVKVEDKVLIDNEMETVTQVHVPLGVVGGITPWNFPPLMACWKLGEVVMTGNTLVLKSSPFTPLTTCLMSELFVDCFPPGVVNLLSGGNQVGEWLTLHPDVAKISFTGSTRTGKAIQKATADTMKRITLECGGNDPAVLLPGVDIKEVAPGIFGNAMNNSGQVCIAIKRCYVHESQAEELIKELTEAAKNAKMGDGMTEGVEYGPLNNKMQFDRVKELTEAAKLDGAKVHVGGDPLPGGGYFFPPTILSNVKEGSRIVDEEQFGPVLPVITYTDVDDVIKRANNTNYGLGASVWGPTAEAAKVAAQIDAGTVWVNQHLNVSPDVPFGGRKESGVGRQMGSATIDGNTDKKIIRVPKPKA
jgi:acyl-CoA reductase-like NAD-dependent aldehyde dehydrogenase